MTIWDPDLCQAGQSWGRWLQHLLAITLGHVFTVISYCYWKFKPNLKNMSGFSGRGGGRDSGGRNSGGRDGGGRGGRDSGGGGRGGGRDSGGRGRGGPPSGRDGGGFTGNLMQAHSNSR